MFGRRERQPHTQAQREAKEWLDGLVPAAEARVRARREKLGSRVYPEWYRPPRDRGVGKHGGPQDIIQHTILEFPNGGLCGWDFYSSRKVVKRHHGGPGKLFVLRSLGAESSTSEDSWGHTSRTFLFMYFDLREIDQRGFFLGGYGMYKVIAPTSERRLVPFREVGFGWRWPEQGGDDDMSWPYA